MSTRPSAREGADEYPGIAGASRADVDALLLALDEYQPVIPDELTNHYLKSAGVADPDVRVTRLISLVTERFVQQIADDAYRCAVQRSQAQAKDKRERGYDTRDKRVVLENEDLAAALRDYGVHLHKPPYFVGAANAEEAEAEEAEEQDEEDNEDQKASSKKRRARR